MFFMAKLHQPPVQELYAMILSHVQERISLSPDEQQFFCSLLKARQLLPRQYLVQEGEICRFESYVCRGFYALSIWTGKATTIPCILPWKTGGFPILRASSGNCRQAAMWLPWNPLLCSSLTNPRWNCFTKKCLRSSVFGGSCMRMPQLHKTNVF